VAAPDQAFLSRSPGETRVALTAGGLLVEAYVFRDSRPAPGDVYLGRVKSLLSHGAAALIDIGAARPAFLGREDAAGGALPPEGAVALVQVLHGPRAGKGAKVSGQVSIPGPLLAYGQARPGVALSSRITNKAERRRLLQWAEAAVKPEEGVVLRTQAFGVPEDALSEALYGQRAAWRDLHQAAAAAAPPLRLRGGAAPLAEALAGRTVEAVVCEGPGSVAQAREARPDLAGVIRRYDGADLFAVEGISDQVEAALAPTVDLPGGARVRIAETAAVVAIDVDTGRLPPGDANALAVGEIARHIRLRNLAGQIVIDFARPRRDPRQALKRLADGLRAALADDPAGAHVLGVSGLGLVEVRRPRRAPPLSELMLGAAPAAPPADEAVALEALRRVVREARAVPGARPRLVVAPAVAALLTGPLDGARREAEQALGHALAVTGRAGLAVEAIEIEA